MTGVTPIYEPNGRVYLQTWVSYGDARREALRVGADLVVLKDVDDATRSRVAHAFPAAIVCTPSAAEAHTFPAAGVYVYRFDAARRGLFGGRDPSSGATPYGPRCVDGRCGR